MRVLVLSPGRFAEGGAERSLALIVAGLVERGHDLRVLGANGSANQVFAEAGASIRILPQTTSSGLAIRHASSLRSRVSLLRAVPAVASVVAEISRQVQEFGPNVLYSNGARTHVMSALLPTRVPVVWAIRDVPPNPLQRKLLAVLSRRTAAIMANSRFAAASLLNDEAQVHVVGNPVRAVGVPPIGSVHPEGRAAVALVAHLHESKGHHVAIAALAKLDPKVRPRLLIAGGLNYPGSSEYRAQLDTQVTELGLADDVEFLGNVADVASVYRQASVLLHPAIHPEGFGRTIVEAMSAGVPVIATRLGGVEEICDGTEAAVLVAPDNPTELASGLEAVLTNPEQRARMVAAGYTVSQRYLPEPHVSRIEQILGGVAR